MQTVEFRLIGDRLTHDGMARHLVQSDFDRFAEWTRRYHGLTGCPGAGDALRLLGQEIHGWLDGDENWLTALHDRADAPVIAEFAAQWQIM